MTAQRSTKEENDYLKHRKKQKAASNKGCPFCVITPGHPEHVAEYDFHRIITVKAPYSLWDGQDVIDHLMLIPKEHTAKMSRPKPKEAVEWMKIIGRYENEGYSLYARAPDNVVKSVFHQHAHLLKLGGKDKKLIFMIKKPKYLRITL